MHILTIIAQIVGFIVIGVSVAFVAFALGSLWVQNAYEVWSEPGSWSGRRVLCMLGLHSFNDSPRNYWQHCQRCERDILVFRKGRQVHGEQPVAKALAEMRRKAG